MGLTFGSIDLLPLQMKSLQVEPRKLHAKRMVEIPEGGADLVTRMTHPPWKVQK